MRERGWPVDAIPVQYEIGSTDIGMGGLFSQSSTGFESPVTIMSSSASKYLFAPFETFQ